jgi:DNA-binding transcriptional LysR family regulator
MNVRKLTYFLAILDQGSIRRAAEQLKMTQPTLSQALASLEEELGVKLLNRSRSGISLTVVGRVVELRAREILSDVARLHEEVSEIQTLSKGEVRLGIASIVAPSVVTTMISRSLRERPGVKIAVKRGGSDELWRKVASGELDVALARMPKRDAIIELATRKLRDDPYVIWANRDHPLTEQQSIQPEDLRRYPWVFSSEWQFTFPEMNAVLESFGGPSLKPAVDSADMEVAAALMSHGPFLSIWPKSCFFDTMIAGRFTSFPLPKKLPACEIGLVWRARREPSPATKIVIRELASIFSEMK